MMRSDFDQKAEALHGMAFIRAWVASGKQPKVGQCNGHQVQVVKSYDPDADTSAKVSDTSDKTSNTCKCYFIPPHMQKHVEDYRLQDENEHVRASAHRHRGRDEAFREHRSAFLAAPRPFNAELLPEAFELEEAIVPSAESSESFDPTPFIQKLIRGARNAKHKERIPKKLTMITKGEKDLPGYTQKGSSRDPFILQALDNALDVFKFYLKQYKYNSIDGKGMPIISTVHYGENYENAFWNGEEMVYGDGSEFFNAFVDFKDVVGHELTHGVTGNRLEYQGEAGALNEHFSDVMGYLVFMYVNGLDVHQANWHLADGILQYKGKSYPLRTFTEERAYDIPGFGTDPQPKKYGDLYRGKEDNEGVHINSGIPNHAFYLFAMELGGNPWEIAGFIWFMTMMTSDFRSDASMADFARATIKVADKFFREEQYVRDAIRRAWKQTEVLL